MRRLGFSLVRCSEVQTWLGVRGPRAGPIAQNLITMETQAQSGVKVRTQDEVGSECRGQRSAFLFPRNELGQDQGQRDTYDEQGGASRDRTDYDGLGPDLVSKATGAGGPGLPDSTLGMGASAALLGNMDDHGTHLHVDHAPPGFLLLLS